MYYTYVLQLSDNTLYKGSTSDIKKRLIDHKYGRVRSTKDRRPVRCILIECYVTKSDATRRERFLKTTEGRRLLRQQLRDTLQLNE
jgi:putative endonuclease